MKKNMFDNFVGRYPVTKTIRFELKPVGKTLEYVTKNGIIDSDNKRAEDYLSMKSIIDDYHREFIDRVLSSVSIDKLDEYYEIYNRTSSMVEKEKLLSNLKKIMRKQVEKAFTNDDEYKRLFRRELIEDLIKFCEGDDKKVSLVRSFSKFTTYFVGFHENRKNMYTSEEKSTSIAYRLVNQNLPKYIGNIKIFSSVRETSISEGLKALQERIQETYPECGNLDGYFIPVGYNKVLTQRGIDVYNSILGELNQYINLYNQQKKDRIPKFSVLFKQILSDKKKPSFIDDKFKSDKEIIESIQLLSDELRKSAFDDKTGLKPLISCFSNFDLNKVYVRKDNITKLSQEMLGDWAALYDVISDRYEIENPIGRIKPERYEKKRRKYYKEIKRYSVADLNAMLSEAEKNERVDEYLKNNIEQKIYEMELAYNEFSTLSVDSGNENYSLKSDEKSIAIIKKYLDSLKSIQSVLKNFVPNEEESEKDEFFYADFINIWESLKKVTLLYDKVRNYITSKPYSIEKVKINFNNPVFLNGWSVDQEKSNSGVIFRDKNNYYLGVIESGQAKFFDKLPEPKDENDSIEKMYYQQASNAQDIQNLMVIDGKTVKVNGKKEKEGEHRGENIILENFKNEYLPNEINRIRKSRSYKNGDTFNKNDLVQYIDYYKQRVIEYKNQYEFNFKDSNEYADFADFSAHVNSQAYQIQMRKVSKEYIFKMVDEGKLYLFQIYNKDFSEHTKGTPNLHTLYWKALFDEENLKDVIYKLNGEAEVFYRKASIDRKNAVVHPKNQPIGIRNKVKGKGPSIFRYDIVKDFRYTCDKFQFHVSINMNFKAKKDDNINISANMAIHDAEEMHIIGIDRGERNLLYLSVIDLNGRIIEQMSLNKLLDIDYHRLLVKRRKDNVEAKQNWTTINTIKELKEGYISQVVHSITSLMIKYNAIIVLEDLNFGFKRGRMKFEYPVYQKFEKALIDKLNYFVDKKKLAEEQGGLFRAYQLTKEFESFKKLGKQSGFLFYVPAWCTSKIDPTTGFINLFRGNLKYKSKEKTKDFISRFDRIWKDTETGYYAMSFDYNSFTFIADDVNTKWTIYSNGERIVRYKDAEKNVDLTKAFTELFEKYSVQVNDYDFKESILAIEDANFYKEYLKLLSMIVQMRNSDETQDTIVSPVRNKNGNFFVTTGEREGVPLDADANGAYNIAKKGLYFVNKIKGTDVENLKTLKLEMNQKDWIQFAQEQVINV